MGVNGIWEIVEPTKHITSFRGLATLEGFQRNYRDFPMLRIGVDTSTWIAAATAAAHAGTVHSQAENTAVKNFLYRLCRLLDVPATFIFVFDGAARPAVKRGISVIHRAPWVAKYAKRLIQDFGFYCHQAPGEAEAELAALNQHGYIDGIISNDGDVFVFGGLNVIRINMSASALDPDKVSVYYSDILEHSDEVNLTRAGFIFHALCAGGDYSLGIQGCGPVIAYALAKHGYGDQLLSAARSLDGAQFAKFLSTWRAQLQHELRYNPHDILSSRHPLVANAITDDFPDLTVLSLYLHPTTSFTLATPPPSHLWRWIPRLPNSRRLSLFCLEHFHWDQATLIKRFREKLWHGVALRLFTFPLTIYTESDRCLSAPDLTSQIINISEYIPAQDGMAEAVRVSVSTTGFTASMGIDSAAQRSSSRPMRVTIPRLIFEKLTALRNITTTIEAPPEAAPEVIELSDSEMEAADVVGSLHDTDIIELD